MQGGQFMFVKSIETLIDVAFKVYEYTQPDLVLEGYLHRWYIIQRNKYFNVYLHKFVGNDDSRGYHDHPWYSVSLLLKGRLIEHRRQNIARSIPWLIPVFRSAKFAHRLQIYKGPVWTLFITGPNYRTWGFYIDTDYMGEVWIPFNKMTKTKKERAC